MTTRYNITFPTDESYTEAWIYCMTVGIGFSYVREERWIEPTPESPEEDADTIKRLEGIANAAEPLHTSMIGGGVGW